MKKVLAVIFVLALVLNFGLSAFAEAIDDGSIVVAEINGKRFLGVETNEDITKFFAADGSEEFFVDLTDDADMNVCDLVVLELKPADINEDGVIDKTDNEMIRKLIIGAN